MACQPTCTEHTHVLGTMGMAQKEQGWGEYRAFEYDNSRPQTKAFKTLVVTFNLEKECSIFIERILQKHYRTTNAF